MSYYSSFRTGGGGGMRFTVNSNAAKPPSRGISRKSSKIRQKRPESSNRLMNEDKNNNSRASKGVSLSRTQGKRASRIIFSEKQASIPKKEPEYTPSYPSSSYIIRDYKPPMSTANKPVKPGISTYMNNAIQKPSMMTSSSIIGSTPTPGLAANPSSSNFPKKIVVPHPEPPSVPGSSYIDSLRRKDSYTTSNEPNSKHICLQIYPNFSTFSIILPIHFNDIHNRHRQVIS